MLGGSFSNHKSMRVSEVVSDSSPEMRTTQAANVVRLTLPGSPVSGVAARSRPTPARGRVAGLRLIRHSKYIPRESRISRVSRIPWAP